MWFYLQMIDSPEDCLLFEELYEKYKKRMLWIANYVLRDKTEAEDAVHEAFLGIAKSFASVRAIPADRRKFYLFRCAKNAAFKVAKKRGDAILADEGELDGMKVVVSKPENRVMECIDELPETDRDILMLFDYYGFSMRECAKKLEITEVAARKRHQRAVEHLEKLCEKEGVL